MAEEVYDEAILDIVPPKCLLGDAVTVKVRVNFHPR